MRAVCAVATLLAVSGCGGESNVPQGDPADNIRKLALAFVQYAAQNGGAGPADEATLTAFMVKRSQVPEEDVAKRFVSPRDNEPYVIRWGVHPEDVGPIGPTVPKPPIIAYEKTGADGTRYVADGRMSIVEMSDKEFAEALPTP